MALDPALSESRGIRASVRMGALGWHGRGRTKSAPPNVGSGGGGAGRERRAGGAVLAQVEAQVEGGLEADQDQERADGSAEEGDDQ